MTSSWEMIAGEYPPEPGGVADYTAAVARGLAHRGDVVRVWLGGNEQLCRRDDVGVNEHRCAGRFDSVGLRNLSSELNKLPGPRRILLQYVPHAYGFKGMNVRLTHWLLHRRTRSSDDVRVMFHEVAYPLVRWPWHHTFMALVNRWMAQQLIRSATTLYVSTEAWIPMLKSHGAKASQLRVLPIPSNIPASSESEQVRAIRRSVASDAKKIFVGHFGTYGELVTRELAPAILKLLLLSDDVHVLLIGGRSERFRTKLVAENPSVATKISATGRLGPVDVANHISACDVMLQPYGDGANTRRTTLMACLINSRPVVSNDGHNCEAVWRTSNVIDLARTSKADELANGVLRLLGDEKRRCWLRENVRGFYDAHFSIDRTLDGLQGIS